MDDCIKQLSKTLDIPEDSIYKVYQAYWKFIKTRIEEASFKDGLTEDEFEQIKKNFNIPSIGKLYCTYKRYSNIYNRKKYIYEAKYKKDKTDV